MRQAARQICPCKTPANIIKVVRLVSRPSSTPIEVGTKASAAAPSCGGMYTATISIFSGIAARAGMISCAFSSAIGSVSISRSVSCVRQRAMRAKASGRVPDTALMFVKSSCCKR